MRFSGGDRYGFDLPYLGAVFMNRTVGREFPHAGGIENGLVRPLVLVVPQSADALLAFDIRLVISQNQERVVPKQIFNQRPE